MSRMVAPRLGLPLLLGLAAALPANAASGTDFVLPCAPYAQGLRDGGNFGKLVPGDGAKPFAGSFHLGEDVWLPAGTEVRSIALGKVVYSDFSPTWKDERGATHWNLGNVIVIEHRLDPPEDGLDAVCSVSVHLGGDRRVAVGDVVAAGQVIGRIGKDRSEENGGYPAHLHFGIHMGPYLQISPAWQRNLEEEARDRGMPAGEKGALVRGEIAVARASPTNVLVRFKETGESLVLSLLTGSTALNREVADIAGWCHGYGDRLAVEEWLRPSTWIASRGGPGLGLDYCFAVSDPAERAVDATLILTGASGSLDLALPESTAFVRLAEPRLEGDVSVRALAGGHPRIERTGPYRWRLDPCGEGSVELRWRVRLDHRDLPEIAGRDEYEWPYVEHDHGLLVPGTLVLAPVAARPASLKVRFDLPEGWPVIAPWPEVAAGVFAPPDLRALQDDLVAVGRWDVHREQVGGMELTVAFAPRQEALRDAVLERIGRIVAAELELFGCTPAPAYLFLFGKPQPGGYGGSPKTASMTLFAAPELPVEFALEGIEHLIAHEFHHTWMRARSEPPDELRFVVEGFTDYYAALVPWRLGFRDDAWFARALGQKLAECEESQRASGISLAEAGGAVFFAEGDAYRAVYAGGFSLAFFLDLAIRRQDAERNLDQLMRRFYEDSRWRAEENPTLAGFFDLAEEFAGARFRERVEKFVNEPGSPDLALAFAEVGVELARGERPADLDLRANLEGTKLVLIDPSCASWRVGLRIGDRLLEVNGREVRDEHEVRAAWSAPCDDRVRVRFLRSDVPEPVAIDAPIPRVVEYQVPDEVVAVLR
ncbi:MAG: peptidoglycan DD-metalloendopeptidase family protein [Planctomycetes bacterium]|nr:peptidoglycan DD-metalloendopeptidase family protein [Planctomycetota bacterium]